ncbi:MAG: glycosyltransferase [Geminicoccaceae bacterium]
MNKQPYDVIAVGDFRQMPWRGTIAEQLRGAVSAGYRLGLVQLKSVMIDRPAPIIDEISAMIKEGVLTQLDPDLPARSRLIIATDPRLFTHLPRRALRLDAGIRLVAVQEVPVNMRHEVGFDWPRMAQQAEDVLGGPIIWAPVHLGIRQQLADIEPKPRLSDRDWSEVVNPEAWYQARDGFCGPRPVIGRHAAATAAAWPSDPRDLLTVYPDDSQFVVRLFGGGPILKEIMRPYPRNWGVFSQNDMDPRGFLATIDFFVLGQDPDHLDPGDPCILEAMASGAVAVLPPSFEPIFGDGAVYANPDRLQATVLDLYRDRIAYLRQSRLGVRTVEERFSPARHADRIRELIGSPRPADDHVADARPAPPAKGRRRVLFININGVGMGHVARMLAIARRCPKPIEPVFLSMSQALKVIREQGYLAEYIPSRTYLDCDQNRWNGYLRDELNELIAFYDPAAVLFDGNVPYQGVIDAIKANPDPWFVWSRRGMWRTGNADLFKREQFFDAVLEPGDLADDYDHGITTRYRERTRHVRPIRLLDPGEMLPRGEARRELGLDLAKPAVLIQLGAANNFDFRSIDKTAFAHVTAQHDAQVAVGEWLISEQRAALPDNVVRLPGFPFARYFNAFDLAISGVGYNSFHELLYAGVPTIFVPNEATQQDNQLARALYADRHGLAACVRTREIYGLPNKIDQLLDPTERQQIQRRLGALDPGNGAAEAAAFIEEIVYSRRVDRAS